MTGYNLKKICGRGPYSSDASPVAQIHGSLRSWLLANILLPVIELSPRVPDCWYMYQITVSALIEKSHKI